MKEVFLEVVRQEAKVKPDDSVFDEWASLFPDLTEEEVESKLSDMKGILASGVSGDPTQRHEGFKSCRDEILVRYDEIMKGYG